ncbi:MAG: hypothetical protein HY815_04290 [Candidatus Riflebacteria bacterium]|nr:hypothetical protein [Candidatus Riflebacteria bacterium]
MRHRAFTMCVLVVAGSLTPVVPDSARAAAPPAPVAGPVRSPAPGTDATSVLQQAKALYMLGRFEDARIAVDRAISLAPGNPAAFALLGWIHKLKNELPEAQNAFSQAARLAPDNARVREMAEALTRKLGVFHYAHGVEAFRRQDWARASEHLEKALEKEILGPEQSAIAQQYLVIARFSRQRVAQEIQRIQAEREFVERGYTAKKIGLHEVATHPGSYGFGSYVDFSGWVVARSDDPDGSELTVAPRGRSRFSRSSSTMTDWFTIRTPRPLPGDARAFCGSFVSVRGRLIDSRYIENPINSVTTSRPRPTVLASMIEFPGSSRTLAGPLRIDYLGYSREQRLQLESTAP